eukprot:1084264-Prorocentrum_minimum.AAC.1
MDPFMDPLMDPFMDPLMDPLQGDLDWSRGKRFVPMNLVADPYAPAVVLTPQHMLGALPLMKAFDWGKDAKPGIPQHELIVYHLHPQVCPPMDPL